MDPDIVKTIVMWASLAYGALSTAVLWAFATGRWSRGMSSEVETVRVDVKQIRTDLTDAESMIRELDTRIIGAIERLNTLLGQFTNRVAIMERDVLLIPELRSEMGLLKTELGLMKTELLQATTKARHDAVNALSGQISALDIRKVNADLHESQMTEVHRRLDWLERDTDRGTEGRRQR